MHKIKEYGWFPLYGSTKEEKPHGMLEPKGKPVVTSGFINSSHARCFMTQQSTTCRQNCVETSTYGSVNVEEHIDVDLDIELRYKLRMLGAPVKGTTVRDAVTSRIASVVHWDTKYNMADMGTKSLNGAVH
eukprot:3697449-Ditylum_brightwellii.AAC.1